MCVKCLGAKGTCNWYAYCGYKATQSSWQLRTIINQHNCSKEFSIRLMTSKWLSQRLEKSIRDNPEIKLTNIRNKVGRQWNMGISRSTAHREKTIAYKNIEGSFREQYKMVYDYAHELLKSNLGSTVKVSVEDNEDKKIFRRLYVCLKACKDSFVSYRPIIGLDMFFKRKLWRGVVNSCCKRCQ